jgi:hypothetical protein
VVRNGAKWVSAATRIPANGPGKGHGILADQNTSAFRYMQVRTRAKLWWYSSDQAILGRIVLDYAPQATRVPLWLGDLAPKYGYLPKYTDLSEVTSQTYV